MLIDRNGIVESKRAVWITTNIFWNYGQRTGYVPFSFKELLSVPVIPSVVNRITTIE